MLARESLAALSIFDTWLPPEDRVSREELLRIPNLVSRRRGAALDHHDAPCIRRVGTSSSAVFIGIGSFMTPPDQPRDNGSVVFELLGAGGQHSPCPRFPTGGA